LRIYRGKTPGAKVVLIANLARVKCARARRIVNTESETARVDRGEALFLVFDVKGPPSAGNGEFSEFGGRNGIPECATTTDIHCGEVFGKNVDDGGTRTGCTGCFCRGGKGGQRQRGADQTNEPNESRAG